MKAYWITFEDGTKACCEGQSAYDAQRIAEYLTDKKVKCGDAGGYNYNADENQNIQPLPYPATPIIWQHDHPISGKCPTFCYTPNHCAGHGSCTRNVSCDD